MHRPFTRILLGLLSSWLLFAPKLLGAAPDALVSDPALNRGAVGGPPSPGEPAPLEDVEPASSTLSFMDSVDELHETIRSAHLALLQGRQEPIQLASTKLSAIAQQHAPTLLPAHPHSLRLQWLQLLGEPKTLEPYLAFSARLAQGRALMELSDVVLNPLGADGSADCLPECLLGPLQRMWEEVVNLILASAGIEGLSQALIDHHLKGPKSSTASSWEWLGCRLRQKLWRLRERVAITSSAALDLVQTALSLEGELLPVVIRLFAERLLLISSRLRFFEAIHRALTAVPATNLLGLQDMTNRAVEGLAQFAFKTVPGYLAQLEAKSVARKHEITITSSIPACFAWGNQLSALLSPRILGEASPEDPNDQSPRNILMEGTELASLPESEGGGFLLPSAPEARTLSSDHPSPSPGAGWPNVPNAEDDIYWELWDSMLSSLQSLANASEKLLYDVRNEAVEIFENHENAWTLIEKNFDRVNETWGNVEPDNDRWIATLSLLLQPPTLELSSAPAPETIPRGSLDDHFDYMVARQRYLKFLRPLGKRLKELQSLLLSCPAGSTLGEPSAAMRSLKRHLARVWTCGNALRWSLATIDGILQPLKHCAAIAPQNNSDQSSFSTAYTDTQLGRIERELESALGFVQKMKEALGAISGENIEYLSEPMIKVLEWALLIEEEIFETISSIRTQIAEGPLSMVLGRKRAAQIGRMALLLRRELNDYRHILAPGAIMQIRARVSSQQRMFDGEPLEATEPDEVDALLASVLLEARFLDGEPLEERGDH